MIIEYHVIFGIIGIIVFYLTERIAIDILSRGIYHEYRVCALGFSYNALSTRHDVPGMLHL